MTSENQCEVCHIGALQFRRMTYTSWLNQNLVILPNVVVWVCDVCGELSYDPEAVRRIQMLLGMAPGEHGATRRQEMRADAADQKTQLVVRRRDV